jgi:hypothetical protein
MPFKDLDQKRAYERAYREAHKDVLHARVVACNRRARHERYARMRALKEACHLVCANCHRRRGYLGIRTWDPGHTLELAGIVLTRQGERVQP